MEFRNVHCNETNSVSAATFASFFCAQKHLTHLSVIHCENALDVAVVPKFAQLKSLHSLHLEGSLNKYA
jgi:hypothetical protein